MRTQVTSCEEGNEPAPYDRAFLSWLAGACLIVAMFMGGYYHRGEDSRVLIHDNLDSNVPQFSRLAKSDVFFGSMHSTFQPMLGGVPRNTMRSELHFPLLSYRYLSPLGALVLNELVMRLTALIGMALLLNRILPRGSSRWIVFGVALCFALLPYHPAGHLSVAGLPLLMFSVCQIASRQRLFVHWTIVALFPFFSSVVLIGFALVILLGMYAAWRSVAERRLHWPLLLAWLLLTCGYVVSEYRLAYQMLAERSYASHRVELSTRHPNDLPKALESALENFLEGQYHVASFQYPIILATVVLGLFVGIASAVFDKTSNATWQQRLGDRNLWYTFRPLLLVFAFASFSSLWYGLFTWRVTGEALERFSRGSIKTFNWSRVHWLHPFLWALVFAYALVLAGKWRRAGTFLVILLIGLQLTVILRFHHKSQDSQAMTFREFYSPALFQEIRDKIGRPQQDYRVASLGLHPSIPLYNGFSTVDGYSVNYPLAYKQRFRPIIAPELEKNENLRRYFDDWGSRCYIFSSELGKNFLYSKDEKLRTIRHLKIDSAALKGLGGDYVISAVEIGNANESGLELVEIYERTNSPWKIFLYAVRGTPQE